MSIRTKQIEATLTKTISKVVSEKLNDPRVAGMVTITGVDVSPDMRNASVSVSIVPPEKAGIAMHALREAAGYVRREVGKLVSVRRVPILHFEEDASLKKLAAVFNDINEAMERTRQSEEITEANADDVAPPDEDTPANADTPTSEDQSIGENRSTDKDKPTD